MQDLRGENDRAQKPDGDHGHAKKINPVYQYRLKSEPEKWRTMIAPGCDLAEAEKALRNVFLDRFLEVRERE